MCAFAVITLNLHTHSGIWGLRRDKAHGVKELEERKGTNMVVVVEKIWNVLAFPPHCFTSFPLSAYSSLQHLPPPTNTSSPYPSLFSYPSHFPSLFPSSNSPSSFSHRFTLYLPSPFPFFSHLWALLFSFPSVYRPHLPLHSFFSPFLLSLPNLSPVSLSPTLSFLPLS